MAVATDSASVNVRALEDLMREGARALIDRLGYANAARFIAILGGEGDSVIDIREKRMKSDIDEITERICGLHRNKSLQKISGFRCKSDNPG
jgi:hypothetical protein